MVYFRYIFLILVITGSTSIGFLLSKKYVNRVIELKKISSFINILKNKIRFTHKPLIEALEEIGNIDKNERISNIFLKTSRKIKDKKVLEAWSEAIEEEKFFLDLTNEDINLIKQFGAMLGKEDLEGEISKMEEFSVLLNSQIKKAEGESLKNEKMYKSLGTIIGLAIVIILF